MQTKQAVLAVAVVCTAGLETGAAAQDFDPRTPIEDRARPEYASRPITVGSFEVTPRIEIGAEYIDNLYASDRFNVDDVLLSVRPSVSVADRRTDRELRFNLSTGIQTFANNNASERVQVQARLRARYGLGTSTRPYGGASFRLNDSSQGGLSPGNNPAQPIRNLSYEGNAGAEQDVGDFTVDVEGRIARNDYRGQLIIEDQVIDGNLRDNTIYRGRVRTSYSSRPDQRVYVEGRYARLKYADNGLTAPPGLPGFFLADRSGHSYSVVGGLQFQVTELLSVDANIGYGELSFDDPAQPKVSGLSFEASAFYAPTRLTRFQLQAIRTVDDTVNPLFSSFTRTGVSVAGEHELRRNLIVRGEAEYTEFDAGDSIPAGKEYRASLGAIFYLSPRLSLNLRGEIFDRSGIAAGQQKRGLLSLGYAF